MGTRWPPSCSRSGQRAGGASASPPRGLVRGQPSSVQMCTPSVPAPCAHQADGPEGATPQPPRGLGPVCGPQEEGPFWTQRVGAQGAAQPTPSRWPGCVHSTFTERKPGHQRWPIQTQTQTQTAVGGGPWESLGARRSRQHVWGQMPHAWTSKATVWHPSLVRQEARRLARAAPATATGTACVRPAPPRPPSCCGEGGPQNSRGRVSFWVFSFLI